MIRGDKRFNNIFFITTIAIILTVLALGYNLTYEKNRNNTFKNNTNLEDNSIVTSAEKESYLGAKGNKVVVVDAGHGGYDAGSIGQRGTREKDVTLAVALKLGLLLEKQDVKVIYTRKNDKVTWPSNNKQDLEARARISNNAGADLFISIHLNSYKMKNVRGTETYYSKGSIKGKEIAQLIQDQIVKDVKFEDRGIKPEDYSVFRNVIAPTVLVELGYINNKAEEALLKDSGYQDKFAKAMAKAILKYLKK
jgi:N-acetylmuramoyl-L-alanine amidase